MKIQLTVEELHGGLKPFASFLCKFPKQHKLFPINAFIDTGSPWTSVSAAQLLKKNIPVNSVIDKNDWKKVHLGGCAHKAHPIKEPIEFIFKTEDNKMIRLNPPRVYVYLPMNSDKASKSASYSLPSIIGVDSLIYCDIALYFRPSKQIAWFELQDE